MLYGQGNMEDMLAPPDQKAGDEMADFEDYGEPIQDVGGSSVDGADKKPFHEPRL